MVTTLNIIKHELSYLVCILMWIVTSTTKIASHRHMTFHNLNNASCKVKCKERGSKVDILLLFMCVTKNLKF